MRVGHDGLRGISGVVDEDFLRGDQDVYGMAIGFHIESAVGREFQQVEAGQVGGGIVQEHVLAAGIAGIDSGRVLRGVPAVDGGVVLHSGISAVPGSFGNSMQQSLSFVGLYYCLIGDAAGGEIGGADYRIHEVVGDADRVVGVLKEDGAIGVGVRMGTVVSHRDQGVSFGFFFGLAEDELFNVGMVYVEDDHLGRAARLAAGLDYAGEGVESFHEAERTAGGAAARKGFGGSAQWREIGARA